jgi:hypothetical protein
MSKKRKAEDNAEDASVEKKHKDDALGPDEILIKYRGKEFRAKLSKLRALCKHPALALDGEGSIKAGEDWEIDGNLVVLGAFGGLQEFIYAVENPFEFKPHAVAGDFLVGMGLCAKYFDAPDVLKAVTKTMIDRNAFDTSHPGVDMESAILPSAAALVECKRQADNPLFTLYCYAICVVVASSRCKPNITPVKPTRSANMQVFWDCMRILHLFEFDKAIVKFSVGDVMKKLAS